jgi:hypothetical protein
MDSWNILLVTDGQGGFYTAENITTTKLTLNTFKALTSWWSKP